jgi:ATP-dependent RNA helicase SUPV3L1/SUV3
VDPDYYRAIGYPVYGPRAIRVDMLDRVICSIYDSADQGKFKAQHQMAEWLGCNIPDLYAVLEAMGHQKIYDPADQPVVEANAETPAPATEAAIEKKSETAAADKTEENQENKKTPQVKPELATFRLKRGKAGAKQSADRPAQKKSFDKKSFDKKDNKKSFKKKPKKTDRPNEKEGRIYTAEPKAKPEDSPFAILEQLKVANKDK